MTDTDFRILIIDDDTFVVDALTNILHDYGYETVGFTDPVSGREYAIANHFDLLLLDLAMPEQDGAQIATAVLERKPGAQIMVITAYADEPRLAAALEAGVRGYMLKPFEVSRILDLVADLKERTHGQDVSKSK